jgi:hypothetical protein
MVTYWVPKDAYFFVEYKKLAFLCEKNAPEKDIARKVLKKDFLGLFRRQDLKEN